jgi:hypothetical protein
VTVGGWCLGLARRFRGGLTAAVITGILAVYRCPRIILETHDWYMYRFRDSKVREFLESCITRSVPVNGVEQLCPSQKTVAEIARATGLSDKQAAGTLKRLSKRRLVDQERGYWRVTPGANSRP